jgi:hypothetical protein
MLVGRDIWLSNWQSYERTPVQVRKVLHATFPYVAARIALHVPDEKSRRVGQAGAAASLPVIEEVTHETAE